MLAGLHSGLLWDAGLGGAQGLYAKVRWNGNEDRWCEIPLGGNDVLVAVQAGDRIDEARRIMERHGARCFLDTARRAGDAPAS